MSLTRGRLHHKISFPVATVEFEMTKKNFPVKELIILILAEILFQELTKKKEHG
jgi:hypothetical protein